MQLKLSWWAARSIVGVFPTGAQPWDLMGIDTMALQSGLRQETGRGNSEVVDNCHLSKSSKIVFDNGNVRQWEAGAGCDGLCVVPVLSPDFCFEWGSELSVNGVRKQWRPDFLADGDGGCQGVTWRRKGGRGEGEMTVTVPRWFISCQLHWSTSSEMFTNT